MSSNSVSYNNLILSKDEITALGFYPKNSVLTITDNTGVNTLLYTQMKDVLGLFSYKQACGNIDYKGKTCKVVSVIGHPLVENKFMYDVIVDLGNGNSVKTFISTDSVKHS